MSDSAAHRSLVEQRFPTLMPIATFEPIGDGWTCWTYLVNGDWVVQIPRGDEGAATLLRQIEVLPELAREVSARVPVPELTSRDPVAMGYRRIDGAPPANADGIWPERLGRFLYDLHMVPPEYVGMRDRGPEHTRASLDASLGAIRERALPLLDRRERSDVDATHRSFLDDDRFWRFAPCLIHQDLTSAHVLVTPTGDLSGVIDWEEVGIGDPAIDFAWVLGEEPGAGERALAAYGGAPDDRFLERSRFLWELAPWHDLLHGLDAERPDIVAAGLAAARERIGS